MIFSKKMKQQKTSPKSSLDLRDFKFLWDYVLVKAIREETSSMGLLKPEQYDDKPEFGTVFAVGQGKLLDSGHVEPVHVSVGDTIFFGKYSTEQTRSLGQDWFIIRSEDIKAVLSHEKHSKKIQTR